MDKRKFILDVDTGTDDAMAIIVAMRALKDRLLGITVTHGNQPLPNTLENTLRVVQLMGGGVPVYAGCPEPMVQTMAPGRMQNQRAQPIIQEIDGEVVNIHEEYLPLPEAKIKPEKQHAVSFLVDTLRAAEEKIDIVAVGPATNVGMALRMDPNIAENIGQLVVMGGGVRAVNRTSDAEMNFYMDPEAAQIMITADCPVVIFPLDATTSVLFDKQDALKIRALDNPGANFFADLISGFVDRLIMLGISNQKDPTQHDIAMHDVFCVLWLLDQSFVLDIAQETCDVDFGGSFADGQLIVDSRSYMPKVGDVRVAYRLDKEKIMEHLMKILA